MKPASTKEEAEAAAHTAEHVFIRSLQNAGLEVKVHRVDHDGFAGKVILEAPGLSWDLVLEAVASTNEVIASDLPVVESAEPSLADALRKHPRLRARGDRLKGPVRVVRIGDYDVATCAHGHASRTSAAKFFFVDDLHSLSGGTTEMSFVTGREGIDAMRRAVLSGQRAADALRCKLEALPAEAARVVKELESAKASLGSLTAAALRSIEPEKGPDGVRLFVGELGKVSGRVLQLEVGRLVSEKGMAAVLSYEDAGRTFFLLARSDDVELDCPLALNSVLARVGGKGGGKANFATGGGEGLDRPDTLKALRDEVCKILKRKT
jgi:alanyl-tRNA synthetase